MVEQFFQDLVEDLRRGTVLLLGLLCFLAFAVNLGALLWLAYRRGGTLAVRCPECGRSLTCPHCAEEDLPPARPGTAGGGAAGEHHR